MKLTLTALQVINAVEMLNNCTEVRFTVPAECALSAIRNTLSPTYIELVEKLNDLHKTFGSISAEWDGRRTVFLATEYTFDITPLNIASFMESKGVVPLGFSNIISLFCEPAPASATATPPQSTT